MSLKREKQLDREESNLRRPVLIATAITTVLLAAAGSQFLPKPRPHVENFANCVTLDNGQTQVCGLPPIK